MICAIGFSVFCLAVFRSFYSIVSALYKYTTPFSSPAQSRSFANPYTGHTLEFCYPQAIREETETRVEGESTFAMYRLDIMAVGAFRALFQPLESSSPLCHRALKNGTLHPFPSATPFPRRPGGEFVSLTQTEACLFRSFQRIPMFSLHLRYDRKASPSPFAFACLGIRFSLFLFRCGDSSRA